MQGGLHVCRRAAVVWDTVGDDQGHSKLETMLRIFALSQLCDRSMGKDHVGEAGVESLHSGICTRGPEG